MGKEDNGCAEPSHGRLSLQYAVIHPLGPGSLGHIFAVSPTSRAGQIKESKVAAKPIR